MASSFGNRVLTTTQDKLLPAVVDTVLNSNVLATRMLGAAKSWMGEQLKKPIKVSKNTTGTSFSGFDTLPTAASDTRQRLAFDPKFEQITVSLPLTEISVNKVKDTQVLPLMAVEMESSAEDMADNVGTKFYGDGTGNGSKDLQGLGAIVDDGSVVATYGELSRSTFTTIQATVTASGGSLTLAKMSTLYTDIASGGQIPSLGVVDESVFNLYESLLQPQERVAKSVPMIKGVNASLNSGQGLIGGTGYTGLFFKGFPVLADEKATAQTLFMLNERFLDWYALPMAETTPVNFRSQDIEGNDYSSVQGLGFSWSGWIKPANQAAIIGHIYLGGNFISFNPKRQGKLTGITTA